MDTKQIAQNLIDDDVLIIDTETTGLGEYDFVIEIAAVSLKTHKTYQTIVKPPFMHIFSKSGWDSKYAEAQAIHGITYDEVKENGIDIIAAIDELSLWEAYPNHAAFNAAFDERLINQTIANEASGFLKIPNCIMELANRHLARDYAEWNKEDARFKRLSLARCCEIMGIEFEGKAHRALSDAKATAALVRAIAND